MNRSYLSDERSLWICQSGGKPATSEETGKRRILIIFVACFLLAICYLQFQDTDIVESVKLMFMVNRSRSSYNIKGKQEKDPECQGFDIDPDDPTIAQYIKKKDPISCKGQLPSIFYVQNKARKGGKEMLTFLKVNKTKVTDLKLRFDNCRYTPLKMRLRDDFTLDMFQIAENFSDSIIIPEDVDHLHAECFFQNKLQGYGYFTVVRKKEKIETEKKRQFKLYIDNANPQEILNFLLIGIDGISKPNFARHMPKTKKFLIDEMGAIELYRINKVGLNTFPNVVPLLTGLSQKEVSKTDWIYTSFMDKIDHLFLWDKARKVGYRTGMLLDHRGMTSFHYLKRGWNNPKFDYYNRPVVLKTSSDKKTGKRPCIGDTIDIDLYLKHYIEIARMYNNTRDSPYFLYAFMCALTHHRLNPISGDEVYKGILKTFRDENLLHNTVLLFFSDHGTRVGSYRSTLNGMLEDNNPFMFFVFPPWFEAKYPTMMANFRHNQQTLLTNHDIYSTLYDLFYFQGEEQILNKQLSPHQTRGLSLFRKIKTIRSCEEAGIPMLFCNCRQFSDDNTIPEYVLNLLREKFMESIVNKTSTFRDKCIQLRFNATVSTVNLVKASPTRYYQLTIRTSPGGALYQAILSKTKTDIIGTSVKISSTIDRLNLYRGQADCVDDSLIRPFCFCVNMLTESGKEKIIDQNEDAEFD